VVNPPAKFKAFEDPAFHFALRAGSQDSRLPQLHLSFAISILSTAGGSTGMDLTRTVSEWGEGQHEPGRYWQQECN
jgi:hypothetical protein